MKRKIEYCVRLVVMLLIIAMVFPMVALAANEDLPKLETPNVTWDSKHPGRVKWDRITNTNGFEVKLYRLNKNGNEKLVCTKTVSDYSCDLCVELARSENRYQTVYVTVKAKNKRNVNIASDLGETEAFHEAVLEWEPDYDNKKYRKTYEEYLHIDEGSNWSLFRGACFENHNIKTWSTEKEDDDYCRPGGPYYPSDNEWREGWNESKTYYYKAGVRVRNRWEKIDGDWYYFDNEGRKQTSTFIGQNERYYVNREGMMIDGDWFQYQYQWYYAKPGGIVATGWEYVNGDWYYFDSRGVKQQGRFVDGRNGTKYYVKLKDGTMTDNEWFQYEYQWYYAKPGGDLARGWYNIADVWYHFDYDTGRRYTNQWASSNGKWFYLGEDGMMLQNTWITYNGDRYYLKSGGEMTLGEAWIDGKYYYFNTDGGSRQGALIQ